MELKSCKDFAISFAWWGSHWLDSPWYMLTISSKWQTWPYLSQPWKRNATLSATMQYENQLQWVNDWSLILTLKTTYQTLWPKWSAVVNAVNWLVTSFMTSMMTILSNQPILTNWSWGDWRNPPVSYLLYLLRLTFWLKGRSIQKILIARASSEFCKPGGLYFGYSMLPGVMLASLMHSPESLFPDLQQLLLALMP